MFARIRDAFLRWWAFDCVESALTNGLSILKKRREGHGLTKFKYYLREYNLFLRRYNTGHAKAVETLENLRVEVTAHLKEVPMSTEEDYNRYSCLLALETALVRLKSRL